MGSALAEAPRRGWRFVATVLLLGVATASASAASLSGPAEIIDGDTIRVENTPVRLDGIDAPESRQECEDANGRSYRCGEAATQFLADLIGRQPVTCEIIGTDAYERALGTCRFGDAELNAAMVRSGWALAFRHYSERYAGEEQAARDAGAGLWSGAFDPPWEWRAAITAEAAPGDCVIKGNISQSGERIYHMPFHQHYDRTRIDESAGERWFCSEDEALAAGWRRALR